MSDSKKRDDRRFIAKVKQENGQYGSFQKVLIDNPDPTNRDGTPNKYNQGVLLWLDNKTGKKYQVKQMKVTNVDEASRARGFVLSLCIDLEDGYQVNKLD